MRPQLRPWRGYWTTLIVTSIGTDARTRAALRTALHHRRFGALREGVWMRPDNLELDLDAKDRTRVRIMQTRDDAPAELAGQLWDLAGWARTGHRLLDEIAEAAGIPVYENDAQRLNKAGRPFWLAGLGDQLAYLPARRFRPVHRIGVDDLGATLAKVTDDAPVILLAHEPDVVAHVPGRVALQLSGHTHGGQVRLFGWSPVVPTRYGSRLAYGHAKFNCDVIVSGGLGCSIMPFRLGVPPEIVLVTLGARPALS